MSITKANKRIFNKDTRILSAPRFCLVADTTQTLYAKLSESVKIRVTSKSHFNS